MEKTKIAIRNTVSITPSNIYRSLSLFEIIPHTFLTSGVEPIAHAMISQIRLSRK